MSNQAVTDKDKESYGNLVGHINEYNENKESWDPKQLVNMREKMATELFQLADFHSRLRFNAERADYTRKREVAKEQERIRAEGTNPKTGKKYTRDEIMDKARIACSSFEDAAAEADRQYQKIRLTTDAVNQILHAIASRISITNKNYAQ